MKAVKLDPNKIRTDGGTQPRAATDQRTVTEYSDDMTEGAKFPPVVVFHDGQDYWLADGFHRVLAARVIGAREIEADVRVGTQRDAMLYAAGANAAHGMRRTAADKRRAVLRLLADFEWGKWSDREIARRCAVGHSMVSELRSSLSAPDSEKPFAFPDDEEDTGQRRTYTTKHGTESTMDTSRIGRGDESDEKPDQESDHESYNRTAEKQGTSKVATALVEEIDEVLDALASDSFRHSIINALIKHLRNKSVELNRKAGAA